jgi:two-component system LytT family response regulator
MKYNYVIVEDRKGAFENLLTALKKHTNFILKGHATSVKEAITLILTEKPQLVFLDVELGNESGFDIIREIRQITQNIPFFVMTTDFDKYAKNAVNQDVLYFLDKPIDPDELVKALVKFEKNYLERQEHITIKNTEGHLFMQLETITHITADNSYSLIHRTNETPKIVSKTLKDVDAILPDQFIRIHKSTIVNKKFITQLNTTKQVVILQPKTQNNTQENAKLEFSIGDSYLETVKNTLLSAPTN